MDDERYQFTKGGDIKKETFLVVAGVSRDEDRGNHGEKVLYMMEKYLIKKKKKYNSIMMKLKRKKFLLLIILLYQIMTKAFIKL